MCQDNVFEHVERRRLGIRLPDHEIFHDPLHGLTLNLGQLSYEMNDCYVSFCLDR